jgi:putative oxidoreductase
VWPENEENAMSMKVSEERVAPAGEPRLIIPALAPLYARVRDLSWLLIRLAVGGNLLVHGINKLMGPGVVAFANGSLARRGIEPSLPLAYVVFFNETVGAICLMLGLFTRVIAAMIAVEFALITFVAHWPNGYGFSSPGGGWEFPLMWGLIVFAISLRGGGPYSLDRKLGREI